MENIALSIKLGLGFCTRLVFYREQFKTSIPFVDNTSGLTLWSYSLEGLNFLCSTTANFSSTKNNL